MYACSAVLEALYIILARVTGVAYDVLILLLMWVPGITGIICAGKYFPKQNYLGIRIKGGQYIFWGIFIPIIYLFISYKLFFETQCVLEDDDDDGFEEDDDDLW